MIRDFRLLTRIHPQFLIFAVWKTARPFDSSHYPWEPADEKATAAEPQDRHEKAAGHKGDASPQRPVVTAVASKLEPDSSAVNQSLSRQRPRLDFAAIRRQVTIEQLLERLGWMPLLKGRRPQLRGPCPIHGTSGDSHRSFSVQLDKHVFRCFHAECALQGNVLDLWAAVRRLPLYEATLELIREFNLELPPNREEEPVSSNSSKPR